MIPTPIVVLQVVFPAVLIARLFSARRLSLLAWVLFGMGLVAYIAALTIAGIWLALPWYTGLAYLFVVAVAILSQAPQVRTLRWRPAGRFAWLEAGICALLFVGSSVLLVEAVDARRAPAVPSVNLAFPLTGGTYYVANGGGRELANAHAETLAQRAHAFRGQSAAIDVVRIDGRGLRASGLVPGALSDYASVGEPVLAPCDGRVLQIENEAADMPPPTPDPSTSVGNFVLMDCGEAQVFLAHLQQGSVAVRPGQVVTAGVPLGAIGNSGNSDEPHLHIHAQRAAAADATSMLDGAPVPMTFYGRALARNDLVRTAAVPPPIFTETELLYGQLGSTMVALVMLVVSVRRRKAGLVLFAVLFAWASAINTRTALIAPADYLGYGAFAVSEVYRRFIFGFFAQHVTAIVLAIAAAQAAIAVALLARRRWRRVALAGAIVFLLAIVPLGIGAGVPATVIMALGAGVLWRDPVARPAALSRHATERLRRAA